MRSSTHLDKEIEKIVRLLALRLLWRCSLLLAVHLLLALQSAGAAIRLAAHPHQSLLLACGWKGLRGPSH